MYHLFINLKNTYKPLLQTLMKANFTSLGDTISSLESITTNDIYGKSEFVELHGYVEKLMYKNEDSNFQIIKDKNIKFAYIMLPDKSVSSYYNPLYGMPDSSSDKDANTFLKLLILMMQKNDRGNKEK